MRGGPAAGVSAAQICIFIHICSLTAHTADSFRPPRPPATVYALCPPRGTGYASGKNMSALLLRQGVVLLHPALDLCHGIAPRPGPGDDPLQAGVDDHAAAHGAGGGVGEDPAGGRVPPRQIESSPRHVPPGGGDDGVGLGVDAAAELVALAPGDLQGLP